MKILKRSSGDIRIEEAHGGSGFRKVYVDKTHMKSSAFEALTHGYLPAGKTFDWHEHDKIEEIMIVVSGTGEVHDEDGKYVYSDGDIFIFPANVQHKIVNPSTLQHEMIFLRVAI